MKKIFTTAFVLGALLFAPTALASTTDYSHFWSFDEGTGRSVNDAIDGQNGVMNGSSTAFGWASGKVGTALAMDGAVGTGIVLPNGFLKGSQGSIALWVNVQNLSDQNIIFSGKSISDNNIYAAFMVDRDGRLQLQFRDTTGGNDRKAQGTHLLNKNEWYHLVITANGLGYHMYWNGIEMTVAGDNIGRWFPDITNQTLMYRIGSLASTPLSGSFNGYLDDMKMYDRALTADEVATLFNEGNAARPTVPAGVAAKANLTISDDHIPYGGSVALNWTSANADSCTAGGSWSGAVATSGSMVFVKLATDATYTLSCANRYGTDSSTVRVVIGASTPAGTGLTVAAVVTGNGNGNGNSVSNGNGPSAIPPGIMMQIARNLTLGARGDEVKALQQFLVRKGFLDANLPLGYFGGLTKAAVVKFQKENGLPSTGFVGPMTRAVLNNSK